MTADIVNLNRARKAKARSDKERQAAENRIRFGRSKADRSKSEREQGLAARRIEGHKREPGEDGGPDSSS